MRARATRRGVALAGVLALALGVLAFGVAGAVSYGRAYDLHRGFSALPELGDLGSGREFTVHFHSAALHRRADYLVDLPPGYSRARRYPVYYLLHGTPSKPQVFINVADMDVRLANQVALGRARPMILVYPDGRIHGSYFSDSEWANTPSGDFESYLIDVVHDVDRRFSTIDSRDGRDLAGFSMGAYGAMNIGLHHLGLFANIQAWSGYYIETHNGVFAHASAATMAYNSPGELIVHLRHAIRRDPLRVEMYVGRRDPDVEQQGPMAAALRAAGASASAQVEPGGHDWGLWWPHLNAMIDLASFDLHHPPRRPARIPTGPIRPVPDIVIHHHHRQRAHETLAAGAGLGSLGAIAAAEAAPPAPPAARTLRTIGALLLAFVASALINLGFVMQHRAHEATGGGLRRAARSPTWLVGQAVGWLGWAGQIVAVALVPLTVVQALAAGSLAVSVPLAAWLFGYPVSREQRIVVAAIGVALAGLLVGGVPGGHLRDGLLIAMVIGLGAGAWVACRLGGSSVRASAAGILYAVADAAIKADAIALRHHGPGGLLGGWTICAALATLGGFLAFQSALGGRDTVRPLSLMAALTAVTGVACGLVAFTEPLGPNLALGIVHAAAIAAVLACIPLLVRVQAAIAHGDALDVADADAGSAGASARPTRRRLPRPSRVALRRRGRAAGGRAIVVLLGILTGVAAIGLLFWLRDQHWLGVGPSVPDALPLLVLARHSGQPLLRVGVACALAGLALGAVLHRLPPSTRLLLVAAPIAVLLLFASDASQALAHNVALGPVMLGQTPGLGAWLECLVIGLAAGLPGVRAAPRTTVAAGVPSGPLPA